MTREKKEIIKKIDWLCEMIRTDEQLGCGFAPAGYYDEAYQEIARLEDKLARLQGFKDMEAKMEWICERFDVFNPNEFPFNV